MVNRLALQYPVVLVHGIVAHDRKSVIPFWGRIPETLRERGVAVFFGNTDSWGNYETNAEILQTAIEKILRETKKEKVNIIAHSKGGIDARYYIWKYNAGDAVASVTTIATPHHGSEIADLLYRQKAVHSGIAHKALALFGKLYGDQRPDPYRVNQQLTTEKMKAFNATVGIDKRVYYQSVYTTMGNSCDDLLFFFSHRYIQTIRGANDGVVSAYSANWGNTVVKIADGISHAEITDYKMKDIAGVYIPGLYVQIADALGRKGF
jgi:pimeloyl-ACP methyl ester carboxylesterase